MDEKRVKSFRQLVRRYYRLHGRHDLPWRQAEADGSFDPYKIVVSEVMLQQTQVPRVIPKFLAFIDQFPTAGVLAAAPLSEVLRAWSGLGYNRRAKFLWQAAQAVASTGFPADRAGLEKLPGIGANTAGAILAYAYNQPVIFIETNIRTVYIHHFFADAAAVPDKDIADMLVRTLPHAPREWYWALMDYGTHLKQTVGNLSKTSAHYTKQPVFQGSRRQIRGRVMQLLAGGSKTEAELAAAINDDRLGSVLDDLIHENLIKQVSIRYSL